MTRFTIRTALSIIAVIAIGSAAARVMYYRSVREQAIADVYAANGLLFFENDPEIVFYELGCVRLSGTLAERGKGRVRSVVLDGVSYVENPFDNCSFFAFSGLDASHCEVTSKDIEALLKLPDTQRLILASRTIDDTAIPILSQLKNLKGVEIRCPRMSEDGIRALKGKLRDCEVKEVRSNGDIVLY